jgi:hypothetical protein
MNAPTSPVTENVADLDSGITEDEFPNGDDLAFPAPLTCPGCRSSLKVAAPTAAWGGAACSRRGIASLILGAQINRVLPAADSIGWWERPFDRSRLTSNGLATAKPHDPPIDSARYILGGSGVPQLRHHPGTTRPCDLGRRANRAE